MTIGEKIKELRDSRGLRQEDLAEIAKVSKTAVSGWETMGKVPRAGAIELMAKYFNIPKSVILCPDEKASSTENGERNMYVKDILDKISNMSYEDIIKVREMLDWISLDKADFATAQEIIQAIRRHTK